MTSTGEFVTLDEIRAAGKRLEEVCLRTPVWPSRILSRMAGGTTLLKCENLQRTGSFKIRGAYNRIAKLSPEQRARGVVAASAGNHAQGVALGASLLGVSSTVFMPAGAPLPKVEADKFGMTADIAHKRAPTEDYDNKKEVLTGTIRALRQGPRGELIFTLDNNQVWRQDQPSPNISFSVGEAVRIEHGAMSSLWLAADHGRKTKVRRVS